MTQEIRHLPRFLSLYPKKARTLKTKFIPYLSISALKEKEGKSKEIFKQVEGKFIRWGMFKRPVFVSEKPIVDGKNVLPTGKEFIVAWAGNVTESGEYAPQRMLKGLLGNDKFTHYHVIYSSEENNRSPSLTSVFLPRKLLEDHVPRKD
ncbi:TPA: hypothetical protein HA225_01780 [Candidatus Micrarchaeota archaeon]|nr:hypothetical protein [Candidatus Micrarchaeota archaeon]HIH31036.1 hypothetical protein [Candidatus Micrarchaeota archaeon]